MRVRFISVSVFLCFFLCAAGCIKVPEPKTASVEIEKDKLAAHVQFLAQPALKGRKPGTRGSAVARTYIKNHFKSVGLVPWGECEDYEFRFEFGTHLLGVLKGSDEKLSEEYVLIGAHYDHVGRSKGKICPGACDNASGVSAMLELTEYFSDPQHKPKRSICFVAFDCEEMLMLGSWLLSTDPRFDMNKLAGVINIDALGRKFMGYAENTLFVTGSELWPGIRKSVMAENSDHLHLLPIGNDIVGQFGDHAAFCRLQIPVLFFCCGVYPGYHKPEDTPEKINYELMKNEVVAISHIAERLVSSEEFRTRTYSTEGDRDELRSFIFLVDELEKQDEKKRNELTCGQYAKLKEISNEAKEFLSSQDYTYKQRYRFGHKVVYTIFPMILASIFDSQVQIELDMNLSRKFDWLPEDVYRVNDSSDRLFAVCVRDFTRCHSRFVFNHKFSHSEMISFVNPVKLLSGDGKNEDSLWRIYYSNNSEGFTSRNLKRLKSNDESLVIADNFRGSREQGFVYAILRWLKSADNKDEQGVWKNVAEVFSGEKLPDDPNKWLAEYCSITKPEKSKLWLPDLARGDNEFIAVQAIALICSVDGQLEKRLDVFADIARDTTRHADVRMRAIMELYELKTDRRIKLIGDSELKRIFSELLSWKTDNSILKLAFFKFANENPGFVDRKTVNAALRSAILDSEGELFSRFYLLLKIREKNQNIFSDEELNSVLSTVADDENMTVGIRYAAVDMLKKTADKKILSRLVSYLDNKEWVSGLILIENKKIIKKMETLSSISAKRLFEFTGKNFGSDAEKWASFLDGENAAAAAVKTAEVAEGIEEDQPATVEM